MIVPFRQAPDEPKAPAPPDPVYLAMAAAQMHTQGRLFEPKVEDAKTDK